MGKSHRIVESHQCKWPKFTLVPGTHFRAWITVQAQLRSQPALSLTRALPGLGRLPRSEGCFGAAWTHQSTPCSSK